uniref:Uncharacterized protein n=1 Tax=Acrobeloides nanus TaxID=290746 RepID=A0A914DCL0_9BILA
MGEISGFKRLVCGDINDAMDKLACIASSLEFTRCVGENCGDEYLDLGKTIMRYMLDEKRAIPGDKVCRVNDCVEYCASTALHKSCGEESHKIFVSSNRIEQLVMILLLLKEEPKLQKGRFCDDIPI